MTERFFCRSGGRFENNGTAATPTIRRQCRNGVMSELMAATPNHMPLNEAGMQ